MRKTIIELTDNNFEAEVLDSEIPVVVDFWAVWCGPCKAMMPIITELAAELEGKAKVGKINVDESPETTERNGVMNIPTLIFFKGGREVSRMVGINPQEKVLKEVEGLL